MSMDLTDDKSTLVQIMVWCHQATSHYLSHCWPRSMTPCGVTRPQWVNTLRLIQNGRQFPDDILKWIFLNVGILIRIAFKFVPGSPINNIPALVQIMAWCRSGNKPLSEPMMVSLLMHICVMLPEWVNAIQIRIKLYWHPIWIGNEISYQIYLWVVSPEVLRSLLRCITCKQVQSSKQAFLKEVISAHVYL